MMRGLAKQLVDYLKADGGWIASGALETKPWFAKKGTRYKPSTVGRTLRALAEGENNVLEARGNSVEYRYRTESEPKPKVPIFGLKDGVRVFLGYE